MYVDLAKWLWEQFGKDLAHFAKAKWGVFNWVEAEKKYRDRLTEIYSTTRLLGHSKSISISDVYTDVYVLDTQTAHRKFGVKNLPEDGQDGDDNIIRKAAIRLAISENKLFILGKPGAGKTTFLKYLVLKACEGKIKKTPVYISLKEWSDSEGTLDDYLIKQFEICSFPDAKAFIDNLLKSGKALLLFDGLDEVRQEGNIRSEIIRLVNNFAKEFSTNQIFITCRIAAVEYSFEHFTYVEIADFDSKQTTTFVNKWYQGQGQKSKRFLNELSKPENRGFADLTKTPLLLTLLCLAYDELLEFPERRVDLYKEAFDALLKKWDASRDIQRDEIYKGLSTLRKENLLSRIAYQYFQKGIFIFRQDDIVKQITDYLEQLPAADTKDALPDGEAVLRAIEAQHGLIVERAYGIFSFSHLSFQEYLTARYIVQNAGTGTLEELAKNISSDQWSEVIALTVSLLDNADMLLYKMHSSLGNLIASKELINLFGWLNRTILVDNSCPKATRSVILSWQLIKEYLVLNKKVQILALDNKNSKELNELLEVRRCVFTALDRIIQITIKILGLKNIHLIPSLSVYAELFKVFRIYVPDNLYQDKDVEKVLNNLKESVTKDLEINIADIEKYFDFAINDYKNLITYLNGTIVILNSLDLATVSDRNGMEEMTLQYPIS